MVPPAARWRVVATALTGLCGQYAGGVVLTLSPERLDAVSGEDVGQVVHVELDRGVGAFEAAESVSIRVAKRKGRRAYPGENSTALARSRVGDAVDDTSASGFGSRSLFTTNFKATARLSDHEIQERTKHLRPSWLPSSLPPAYTQGLSSGVVADLQQSAPQDLKSGVVSGCYGQNYCSSRFVQGLSADVADALLSEWSSVWGAGFEPNCTVDDVAKEVQCTQYNITSRWQYTGDVFGCVHRSQKYLKYDLPCPSWKPYSDPARTGCDPDGKATHDVVASRAELKQQAAANPEEPASVKEEKMMKIFPGPKILPFVQNVFKKDGTYAVVASWRGLTIERYASGFTNTSLLHGWSLSKSILSLVLGARHAEGKLDITAYAKAPELNQSQKEVRGMTIENMMNMRIGLPADEAAMEGTPTSVWAVANSAGVAALGGVGDPADHKWSYSSGSANMLSRELRYTFPEDADGLAEYASYPWKALFSKIGASSFMCETDAAGTFVFSGYCYASARDWIRIGELVAHKGRVGPGGEVVIPEDWIERTTATYDGAHPEYTHLWYRLDRLYGWQTPVLAARGHNGQEILIVPAYQFVFARFGSKDSNFIEDVDYTGNSVVADLLLWLSRG